MKRAPGFSKVLRKLTVITLFILDPSALWFAIYFAFALLGFMNRYIFYPFLLLDIVNRSTTLLDVKKALVTPGIQLLSTTLLGVILLWIFGVVASYSFQGLFNGDDCQYFWQCLLTQMDYSIGGFAYYWDRGLISAKDNPKFPEVVLFNVANFIVCPVIILNVIFGVILDTFSSLRTARKDAIEDMYQTCTICNLRRDVLDTTHNGFKEHLQSEHNMYDYMMFMWHLWETDPCDYNGAESYVAKKLKSGDTSWFPLGNALRLESAKTNDSDIDTDSSDDDALNEAVKKLKTNQNRIKQIVSKISLATKGRAAPAATNKIPFSV